MHSRHGLPQTIPMHRCPTKGLSSLGPNHLAPNQGLSPSYAALQVHTLEQRETSTANQELAPSHAHVQVAFGVLSSSPTWLGSQEPPLPHDPNDVFCSYHHCPMARQHQRGMSRRCLQFGEAQPESTTNCSSSPNLVNDMITTISPATTSETKGFDSSHEDLGATSRKRYWFTLKQHY